MIRIPSWREIFALFRRPKTVAHAVAGIELAATHAESVVGYNGDKAQRERNDAAEARAKAASHDEAAADHQAEADRAVRVAGNLRALIA